MSTCTCTKWGFMSVVSMITSDLSGTTAYDYIHIGTGTTAPTLDDTQLETFFTAASATGTAATTAYNGDTMQLANTFAAGTFAGETITEAAISTIATDHPSPDGFMLTRRTFTGIVLQATDSLAVTYKVQISGP